MATQYLTVNMEPGGVLPRVSASQYDAELRTLSIDLKSGNVPFTPPEGATATVDGRKPDKKGFSYPVELTENLYGCNTCFTVKQQMTAVAGDVLCQITVRDGMDKIIGSGNFILEVERAALPEDADMSASDYAIVEQLIKTATDAAKSSDDAAKAAKTAETNAEASQTASANSAAAAKDSERKAATAKAGAETALAGARQSEQNASDILDRNKEVAVRTPHVGANGNWFVWDNAASAYEDSGTHAQGIKGDKGDTGAKGDKGDTGPQGPKGDPGEVRSVNGQVGDVVLNMGAVYCTCQTAENVAAKVATVVCGDFTLRSGTCILVQFKEYNTAENPTLNVNDTGAIAIKYSKAIAVEPYWWYAKAVVQLVYDGSYWMVTDPGKATNLFFGRVRLSSATGRSDGESGGIAATPYAVKQAYDKANAANTAAANAKSQADSAYNLANGKPSLLDCWPIGSIYIAYNHTSPASLFGGDWARISGRFLFGTAASGNIGSTGGETNHTLTENEMPSHMHDGIYYKSNGTALNISSGSTAYKFQWTAKGTGISGTELRTGYSGGGAAHNNMPPFINVSIWRRTA